MNIRHVVLLALSGLAVVNLSAMKRLREENSQLDMSTVLSLGQSTTIREKEYFFPPKVIIGNFEAPTQQAQQTATITLHSPTFEEHNVLIGNIYSDNIKAIEKSLKEGLDINTCLFIDYAALHNKKDIISLFFQHGARMNCSNSSTLSFVNNVEIIQLLLDNGAYINTTSPRDHFNTPLMSHATKGNTAIVRELILHRADITLKNTKGQSAYNRACKYMKRFALIDILQTQEGARTVITDNFTARFGQNIFSSLRNQQINGSKK
jgi:hypothetical protein